MDKIYFSASTLGFYISSVNETIPPDAKEVSKEDYVSLMEGQQQGFQIIVSDDGNPTLIKNSETEEYRRNKERHWRDLELSKSDIELNKVQDSDKKSQGTVASWREYRKALRNWPEDINFPNEAHRPKLSV